MRKKLKKEYGIEGGVTVVTSTELPAKAFALTADRSKLKVSFYGTCYLLLAAAFQRSIWPQTCEPAARKNVDFALKCLYFALQASFYGTCAYIPAAFGLHASAKVLQVLASDKPQVRLLADE